MSIGINTYTELVIKCFYKVYNALGYGFLEKVYEKAFLIELRKLGINCMRQAPINVYYEELVGEYFADILINNEIILELKVAQCIATEHEAQLLNYLKATNIELGYVFNFGLKPQFVRKAFSNDRK